MLDKDDKGTPHWFWSCWHVHPSSRRYVVTVGLFAPAVQMVVDGQRPHPGPSAAQMDCPAAFVVRPSMLAM